MELESKKPVKQPTSHSTHTHTPV